MSTVQRQLDRLSLWPAIVALTAAVSLSTIFSFSFQFGLVFTLFVVLAGALACCLVLAFEALEKRWWRAASLILALVSAWYLAPVATRAGDYVHLAIMYPAYMSRIRAKGRTAHRTEFQWSGSGFVGGPEVDRTLVYDPSDETALMVGEKQLLGTGVYADYKTAIALFGHFYIVEFHSG